MKSRSWFFIVGLFSIFVLALSVAAVAAISNVTVTIPGGYGHLPPTDTCADGSSNLDVSVQMTGTTSDVAGQDQFAFITYDNSGNVIYVGADWIANGTTATILESIIPGSGSLSNPVSRPFTFVFYDIPYYTFPSGVYSLTTANWIIANGTQMASTTFDPAFDPACAALPWTGSVSSLTWAPCPDIPDGSVVGAMPSETQAFYAPDKISPDVFINPGTYWVVGEDDSGQYYKIMLACEFLWVPIDSVQPSYQSPWSGQPLPTRVVS